MNLDTSARATDGALSMGASDTSGPVSQGISPLAVLRSLRRFAWLVVLCAGLSTAAAYLWVERQIPIYTSTATLEYNPRPPRPLGQEVEDVGDPIGSYLSTREFIETQNHVMQSRAVVRRTVERLELHQVAGFFGVPEEEFRPQPVDRAVELLTSRVSVQPVRSTLLVDVTVRDPSPERAQLIGNTLVEIFIEKSLEDRLASTVNALDWLVEQLDDLRNQLETSELSLYEFKQEHNVLSVSMQDRQNLVAQEMEVLSAALTDTKRARIEQQARLDRIRQTSERGLPVDLDDGGATVVEALRQSLQGKQTELERLSTRYGESHPNIVAIRRDIAAVSERLEGQLEGMVSSAELKLRELRQVERGLRSALAAAQDSGLALNLREIEYERLVRARDNRQKLYQHVLERTTETNLTRMLNTSHVKLVDAGTLAREPVSPNRPLTLATGAFAGLMIGLLLTLLLTRLDRRIRGPAEVEQLGLVVLGSLPHIDLAGGESTAFPARDLYVHHNPASSAAESLRTVRTNVTFMAANRDVRAFLVTSPTPQEGKTTVAMNLAVSLAQSGLKVLLIDTDLRRPRVHRSMAVGSEVGISSYLVDASTFEEVTLPTEVENLHVTPCGPVPPNPAELLHTARFHAFIETAKGQYDRLVFDSPPLGAVSDAAVIAPQVDGAIMVVKADHTTRDGLISSLRQLQDVDAHLLGAVVNDVDVKRAGYYGRYHHYYRDDGYRYAEEPAAGE